MSSKKVLILYYSGGGNTQRMAKAIAEAMKSSAMSVTIEDVVKFDISSLPNYDSIVFGSPTYFSNVAWQVKKVIDESIVHYRGGELKGKVAGIFTSAGTSRDGKDCLKVLEVALGVRDPTLIAITFSLVWAIYSIILFGYVFLVKGRRDRNKLKTIKEEDPFPPSLIREWEALWEITIKRRKDNQGMGNSDWN
jgi:multimeric flavodoxin WrbA